LKRGARQGGGEAQTPRPNCWPRTAPADPERVLQVVALAPGHSDGFAQAYGGYFNASETKEKNDEDVAGWRGCGRRGSRGRVHGVGRTDSRQRAGAGEI